MFLENNSANEGKCSYLLLDRNRFLDTRSRQSYLPVASQNAHLRILEAIKIRARKVEIRVEIQWSSKRAPCR